MRARAQTHVGLKREINEDKCFSDTSLGLFIVADGMGGHAGGDTASRMVVEIVRDKVRNLYLGDPSNPDRHMDDQEVLAFLSQSIRDASAAIYQASQTDSQLTGMGTTVTLMLVRGERVYVAHVGDSRLYRLRQNKLEQLTDDHSLVAEQIKAGFLTQEEARFSRFRNIITRSVGFESEVKVDTFLLTIQPQDFFLLCSDGLNGMVRDEVIYQAMIGHRFEQVANRLIEKANRAGGEDNITVVVVQYNQNGELYPRKHRIRTKKRKQIRKVRKKS